MDKLGSKVIHGLPTLSTPANQPADFSNLLQTVHGMPGGQKARLLVQNERSKLFVELVDVCALFDLAEYQFSVRRG